MSKDIWHTKNETPRQESRVLWESGNVVCGGRFDTHYKCFCGPASQFVDLRNVNRWCYVDDLIKENELTRKALDVAVDEITKIKVAAESVGIGFFMTAAISALAKIKTALEQKD